MKCKVELGQNKVTRIHPHDHPRDVGLLAAAHAHNAFLRHHGGGDPAQQVNNQNLILKLIRIAALLGGDENDVVCGSFVGYDHVLGRQDRGFEKNLEKFKKVFTPILNYAKDLGVTVCVDR